MATTNQKVRHRPNLNRRKQNAVGQTETFRGFTEAESFIGSTTSPTPSRIAEGLERDTAKLQKIHDEMMITLNKIESEIKALHEDVDKIEENYSLII
jgi:hypothetical protein|tara:strand:+ start:171 stop:461 length:291 start_codon:yes stop_codon:yes gene_type:complete